MDKKRKVTLVCFLAIALIALFVVFFIFKKASSTKQTNDHLLPCFHCHENLVPNRRLQARCGIQKHMEGGGGV